MADIFDAIDDLIDDQLAAGPRRPVAERCWHCNRDWHGLPITDLIANMYRRGRYDIAYTAAEDTSRVLCQGSTFIGPMPAQYAHPTYTYGKTGRNRGA